ncbi:MAG: ECF transporter S component [Cellulosilyticaceae bacterium]
MEVEEVKEVKEVKKKEVDIRVIAFVGFGMALNILGAFIGLTFRLPIYMDSIGTMLVACVLGPKYAVLTGMGGSIISGLTFDIYSLYFTPIHIATGLMAGLMYSKHFLKGKKTPLGVLAISLPTSIIGSIIAAGVFGGVTSAGSSYIVQVLNMFDVPIVVSVFCTQVVTDYLDEYVAVIFVAAACKVLPKQFKRLQTHRS